MKTAAVSETVPRRVLHVGCGGEQLPSWLDGVEEIRLDISPEAKPDIVASILDMGEIGQFEGVYSSHVLEHVYPHEAPVALSEFMRVLVPGGACIAIVPDLTDVRPTEEVVYVSPGGPVTGLDMIYGFRKLISSMPHMAHHNGFIAPTLHAAFAAAGFVNVKTCQVDKINLLAVGYKP